MVRHRHLVRDRLILDVLLAVGRRARRFHRDCKTRHARLVRHAVAVSQRRVRVARIGHRRSCGVSYRTRRSGVRRHDVRGRELLARTRSKRCDGLVQPRQLVRDDDVRERHAARVRHGQLVRNRLVLDVLAVRGRARRLLRDRKARNARLVRHAVAVRQRRVCVARIGHSRSRGIAHRARRRGVRRYDVRGRELLARTRRERCDGLVQPRQLVRDDDVRERHAARVRHGQLVRNRLVLDVLAVRGRARRLLRDRKARNARLVRHAVAVRQRRVCVARIGHSRSRGIAHRARRRGVRRYDVRGRELLARTRRERCDGLVQPRQLVRDDDVRERHAARVRHGQLVRDRLVLDVLALCGRARRLLRDRKARNARRIRHARRSAQLYAFCARIVRRHGRSVDHLARRRGVRGHDVSSRKVLARARRERRDGLVQPRQLVRDDDVRKGHVARVGHRDLVRDRLIFKVLAAVCRFARRNLDDFHIRRARRILHTGFVRQLRARIARIDRRNGRGVEHRACLGVICSHDVRGRDLLDLSNRERRDRPFKARQLVVDLDVRKGQGTCILHRDHILDGIAFKEVTARGTVRRFLRNGNARDAAVGVDCRQRVGNTIFRDVDDDAVFCVGNVRVVRAVAHAQPVVILLFRDLVRQLADEISAVGQQRARLRLAVQDRQRLEDRIRIVHGADREAEAQGVIQIGAGAVLHLLFHADLTLNDLVGHDEFIAGPALRVHLVMVLVRVGFGVGYFVVADGKGVVLGRILGSLFDEIARRRLRLAQTVVPILAEASDRQCAVCRVRAVGTHRFPAGGRLYLKQEACGAARDGRTVFILFDERKARGDSRFARRVPGVRQRPDVRRVSDLAAVIALDAILRAACRRFVGIEAKLAARFRGGEDRTVERHACLIHRVDDLSASRIRLIKALRPLAVVVDEHIVPGGRPCVVCTERCALFDLTVSQQLHVDTFAIVPTGPSLLRKETSGRRFKTVNKACCLISAIVR